MSTPIGPHAAQNRRLRWALRIGGVALLALGIWFVAEVRRSLPPSPPEVGPAATVLPVPKPLPEFTLTDDAGEPFTRESFEGHWSFVFFGYTACPSICPITMGTLRELRQALLAGSPPVDDERIVFISIDPARDDPAALKRYVHHFDPTFVGAGGDPADLDRLTRALGVFHERVPGGTATRYDFDHTSSVLLVNPEAALYAVFSQPIEPEDAAEAFRAIRATRK